jgi:hypothetical protein
MSWKYYCSLAALCGLAPLWGATPAQAQVTLNINRATGATTLGNQTGAAIGLDNYAIRSADGLLNVGGWSPFSTSGVAGAGWQQANPTVNQIAELRLTGQHNFTNGSTLALGNILAPLPQYSIDPALSVDVILPNGTAAPTVVNYAGPRNNLVLTVNPYSGATSIKNDSPTAAQIDNYAINSLVGGLNPTTWTSLADAGQTGWQEANPSNEALNELRLTGFTTIAPGASLNLGNAYRTDGYRDLSMQFTPIGHTDLKTAYVDYVGSPAAGQEIRAEGVTIADVSSELALGGFDRPAEHLLDASGLNVGDGTHTNGIEGVHWLNGGFGFTAGVEDASPFLVFDLGESMDLTKARIWNYNEIAGTDPQGNPIIFANRGVNEFEVSVSASASGPFTSLGDFTLDAAPGLGDVDYSETLAMAADNVRFVRFDILSNHNGVTYPATAGLTDTAFVGLSEVQFFGVRASFLLGDTNGDGQVNLDDLNNVRNNFGSTGFGDATGDGVVDLDDLNAVRNNFGVSSGGANPVPEPGTFALAALTGIAALAFFRRRA